MIGMDTYELLFVVEGSGYLGGYHFLKEVGAERVSKIVLGT